MEFLKRTLCKMNFLWELLVSLFSSTHSKGTLTNSLVQQELCYEGEKDEARKSRAIRNKLGQVRNLGVSGRKSLKERTFTDCSAELGIF